MPERIILDTDIGDDIDDAYALSMLLNAPEFTLEGVVTVHGAVDRRAQMARKLLRLAGRDDIPCLPGRSGQGDPEAVPNQTRWAQDEKAPRGDGGAFIAETLLASPGEISLAAIGAYTNVAAALAVDGVAKAVKRIFLMGGSVRRGYGSPTPEAEYNVKCDPAAAQRVLDLAPGKIHLVPLDVTARALLTPAQLAQIAASERPLARATTEILPYWRGDRTDIMPCLHDPLCCALMVRPEFCRGQMLRLEVTADGMTREIAGRPNAFVFLEPDLGPFFPFFMQRLLA
jgi:inosine-uridine nucleoside N-ribohydrolase